jgi:ATP-dependent DNA helicase RecQ
MNIHESLNKYFGFDGFRQGQEEVVSRILSGESAAAIFPTGAGKSLCYQLPALLLPHMTLVVSPLLSLMKDQLDFLLSHKIQAARLDSSLTGREYDSIISRAEKGDLKILMISVERFKNERFRSHLRRMKISLLVVDEAHCISEWGHNFRPEYLRLPDYRKEFSIEKVLLLTATATEQVSEDMRLKFDIKKENVVSTGFYRKNLFLKVSPIEESRKKEKLLLDFSRSSGEPTIIYVTLQKTAEEIAGFLISHKINAAAYHGGMKQDDRVVIQNRFMDGSLDCVVATIAFGMGIDKNNIRKIIHYNLPKSIENYSQEIGRSGRDENPSVCELYGNKSNLAVLENFIYGDTPEKESISIVLEDLQKSSDHWEIKLSSLSRETNIRLLPLKTLLVYLSIAGLIKPQYTYFEEYTFKYLIDPQQIITNFEGERRSFVEALLNNCHSKTVWTAVDIESMIVSYGAERKRIMTALDYFHEKQWIDLSARQSVEVYEVLKRDFNREALCAEMYKLFKEKEKTEIERIHNMISFFESDECYSRKLAAYFGEKLTIENCGHCSFCREGAVSLGDHDKKLLFPEGEKESLLEKVRAILGTSASVENMTRFLCGLSSPLFSRIKSRESAGFGKLEKYFYSDVKNWIRKAD